MLRHPEGKRVDAHFQCSGPFPATGVVARALYVKNPGGQMGDGVAAQDQGVLAAPFPKGPVQIQDDFRGRLLLSQKLQPLSVISAPIRKPHRPKTSLVVNSCLISSIIEHPKEHGKKYNKWLGENKKRTHRDELREAIDIALVEKPRTLDAFLKLLAVMGWEIKRGRHIAFRKPGQQRFMRMDSLGEEYSDEALEAIFKGSRSHKPKRNYHSLPRQNERLALLIKIQSKIQVGKGPGYERWAKTYYLKQMAKTLLYMSEHDLDFATLKKKASDATARNNELLKQINAIDRHLKEISTLKIHIINYVRTKDVYQEYHRHGNSKKFADTHEQELAMHREAKKAFDTLGFKKLPTVKSLSAEYEQQLAEKRKLYAEYQKVHAEMQEMLTVRANMEQILAQDEANKEQERNRQNVR